ncbi:bladder cancer-associated protein [Planococcus citri]|uniref:bladder cancer-associated protein n=1 Tax=Planococcus citri TaxID=170843 RepID=UPI0031F7338C
MYCLQWLIPVLLLPKPLNSPMLQTHSVFMLLYLAGFFLERKPCTMCSIIFIAAVILLCYSGVGNCLFWTTCEDTNTCESEVY